MLNWFLESIKNARICLHGIYLLVSARVNLFSWFCSKSRINSNVSLIVLASTVKVENSENGLLITIEIKEIDDLMHRIDITRPPNNSFDDLILNEIKYNLQFDPKFSPKWIVIQQRQRTG